MLATVSETRERCPECRHTGPHPSILTGGPNNHARVNECAQCGERWQ